MTDPFGQFGYSSKEDYQDFARQQADRIGAPPELFLGLIDHESIGWNPLARNPKSSAKGLGQHLDVSAQLEGMEIRERGKGANVPLDTTDPRYNPWISIEKAADHLYRKYEATGDWHRAVNAYGENNQSYLNKVLGLAKRAYGYLGPNEAIAGGVPSNNDPFARFGQQEGQSETDPFARFGQQEGQSETDPFARFGAVESPADIISGGKASMTPGEQEQYLKSPALPVTGQAQLPSVDPYGSDIGPMSVARIAPPPGTDLAYPEPSVMRGQGGLPGRPQPPAPPSPEITARQLEEEKAALAQIEGQIKDKKALSQFNAERAALDALQKQIEAKVGPLKENVARINAKGGGSPEEIAAHNVQVQELKALEDNYKVQAGEFNARIDQENTQQGGLFRDYQNTIERHNILVNRLQQAKSAPAPLPKSTGTIAGDAALTKALYGLTDEEALAQLKEKYDPESQRKALTPHGIPSQNMFVRGLQSGIAGMGEFAGTGMRAVGHVTGADSIKDTGKEWENYYGPIRKQMEAPPSVAQSYWDNPKQIFNLSKLAYGVGDMIPGMAATVAAAVGGGYAVGAGTATSAAMLARALFAGKLLGGAVGGAQEGASTYREILERGGTENQAVAGGAAMALGSGVLNYLSFGAMTAPGGVEALKTFIATGSKESLKRFGKFLGKTSATEAITEWAEEPWEGVVKQFLIPDKYSWTDFADQLKAGLDVIGPAGIMGAAGGVGGSGIQQTSGFKGKPTLTPEQASEMVGKARPVAQQGMVSPAASMEEPGGVQAPAPTITPDMTFTKVEAVPKATEAPAEAIPVAAPETGQGKAEAVPAISKKPPTTPTPAPAMEGEGGKVFYHGSDVDIEKFDISKAKKWNKFGHFFSLDKEFVSQFGDRISEVNVDIRNPKVITQKQWNDIRGEHAKDDVWFENWKKQLVTEGYDGLRVKSSQENVGKHTVTNPEIVVAFNDSQVTIIPKEQSTPAPAAKEPWGMSKGEFDKEFWLHGRGFTHPRYGQETTIGGITKSADEARGFARVRTDLNGPPSAGEISLIRSSDIPPDFVEQIGDKRSYSPIRSISWKVSESIPGTTKDPHRYIVEKALASGLPVPASVMAEYPDLAKGKGGEVAAAEGKVKEWPGQTRAAETKTIEPPPAKPKPTSSKGEGETKFAVRQPAPPFYSKMVEVVGVEKGGLPGRGTGEQMAKLLESWAAGGKFKADELKWSGIIPWLREQKEIVTKAQILDKIKENMVEVKEVEKGKIRGVEWKIVNLATDEEEGGFATKKDAISFAKNYWPDIDYELVQIAKHGEKNTTKFQSFLNLPPGGENYRELLLTVPYESKFDPSKVRIERDRQSTTQGQTTIYYDGQKVQTYSDNPELKSDGKYEQKPESHWLDVAKKLYDQGDKINRVPQKGDAYQVPSSHAYGDPAADVNRFAHAFVDDRVIDGKKYLAVWELQAGDWRLARLRAADEQAKAEGLTGKAADKRAAELFKSQDTIRGIPAFPFQSNGMEVALKKILRKAAEEGYAGVAWATGDMVKERYDLSKQFDNVKAFKHPDGTFDLSAKSIDGTGPHDLATRVAPDKIESYVGKDLAQKVIGQPEGWKTYSGIDLQIGGEWANRQYDQMMPQFLNKLGKQWGAKVSDIAIQTMEEITGDFDKIADHFQEWATSRGFSEAKLDVMAENDFFKLKAEYEKEYPFSKPVFEPIHTLLITPAMRQSVLYKGLPLYKEKEGYEATKETFPERQAITDTSQESKRGFVYTQDGATTRREFADWQSRYGKEADWDADRGIWDRVEFSEDLAKSEDFKLIHAWATNSGLIPLPTKGAIVAGSILRLSDGRRFLMVDEVAGFGWTPATIALHEIFHQEIRQGNPSAAKLVKLVNKESPITKMFLTKRNDEAARLEIHGETIDTIVEEIAADYRAGKRDFFYEGKTYRLGSAFVSEGEATSLIHKLNREMKGQVKSPEVRGPPGVVKYAVKTPNVEGKKYTPSSPESQEVHDAYKHAESELKDLKSFQWRQAVVKARTYTYDTSANLKRELLKEAGPEGKRIVLRHNLVKGASGKAEMVYEDAVDRIYKGLSKKDEALLNEALRANRSLAILQYKPDHLIPGGLGKTPAQKKRKLQAFLKDVHPDIMRRVQEYSKVMDENLDAMKEAGLLSEKQYTALKEKGDYLKTKYIQYLDPDRMGFDSKGRRITVPDSGIKKLDTGSEQAAEMNSRLLLQEVLVRSYTRIFRNQANEAMYQYITENPDNPFGFKLAQVKKKSKNRKGVDVWRDVSWDEVPDDYDMTAEYAEPKVTYKWDVPPTHTEVSVMQDGKRVRMLMPNKYAREWVESDPLMSHTLSTFIGWVSGTKILKAFATGMNPGFALTNLPRDIAHIWLVTNEYSSFGPKYLTQLSVDLAQTFTDAVMKKGAYKDYVNQGGSMNWLTQQGQLGLAGPLKKLQDILGWFGTFSEIWTRLALRNRALKNGATQEEATGIARNYLDFAQGGSLAKALDSGIPYLNAGIQGTRRIFEAAAQDKGLFWWKIAQIGGLATILYLFNTSYNKDVWDDIPAREKATNWIICPPVPISYIDKNGDKKYLYIRIAKDQGQRLFASIFEGLMGKALGHKVDSEQILQALSDAWPIVPGEKMPPLMSAVYGYINNRDFWRQKEIWRGSKGIEATSEWTKTTHPLLKHAGQYLGMSPERLGHAVGQLIPPTNTYASLFGLGTRQLFDALPEKNRDKMTAELIANIPMVDKLVRSTDPYEKSRKVVEEKRTEYKTRNFEQKRQLGEVFDKHVNDPKDKRNQAVRTFIRTQPVEDHKRLESDLIFLDKFTNIPDRRFWLNLRDLAPEPRADVYWERYKESSPEEQKRLDAQRNKLPGIVSDKFMERLHRLKKGNATKERQPLPATP